MKSIVASAAILAGLALSSSAHSAPITPDLGVTIAPTVSNVACRTVKKTVVRNGRKVVTTTKECGKERRRVYRNGRYYYEGEPGFSIQIR